MEQAGIWPLERTVDLHLLSLVAKLTCRFNRACYIFFGGLLQFVGGLLEFTLGHTFPSVVFCSFGAFFFSVGTGLIPALNTWSSYVPESVPTSAGLKSTEYHAAAGMFSFRRVLVRPGCQLTLK